MNIVHFVTQRQLDGDSEGLPLCKQAYDNPTLWEGAIVSATNHCPAREWGAVIVL